MRALANTLSRLRHDEDGVALLFALVIMIAVLSGLLLDASLLSGEYRSAQLEQTRGALLDTSDYTSGYTIRVTKDARSLALTPNSSGSNGNQIQFNGGGNCLQIWLSAQTIYEIENGNCSTTGAKPLASHVTNTSGQPLITYYAGTTNTSTVITSGVSAAQSIDLNLYLAAPNGSFPFHSVTHIVL
jgi:hypothetical protein